MNGLLTWEFFWGGGLQKSNEDVPRSEVPSSSLWKKMQLSLSGLTVRKTFQTGTQVGSSEPQWLCGNHCDKRIKGTPGITALYSPRVHIDGNVGFIFSSILLSFLPICIKIEK